MLKNIVAVEVPHELLVLNSHDLQVVRYFLLFRGVSLNNTGKLWRPAMGHYSPAGALASNRRFQKRLILDTTVRSEAPAQKESLIVGSRQVLRLDRNFIPVAVKRSVPGKPATPSTGIALQAVFWQCSGF